MKIEPNIPRTEIVADQIVDLILKQKLVPGDRLASEHTLSLMLGVSRSTVREAIRRLASRNVVFTKQGAGTFISQKLGVPEDPLGLTFIGHDARLALELSDLRMLIEPAVAALAAENATEEQIATMESLCEQIKQKVESGQSYINEDLQLHQCIGESCGNSLLCTLTSIMSDASEISIRITKDRFRDVAYTEHLLIVQEIKRRSSRGAKYAMIAHLNSGRDELEALALAQNEHHT